MSVNKIDISILPDKYKKKIKIDNLTNCWNWIGAKKGNGYGNSWLDGRNQPAHRVIYQVFGMVIGESLDLDHLCRNRSCVNPNHLEPVTRAENLKRGLAGENLAMIARAKTHCKRGHEFNMENTRIYRGKRCCRTCARERFYRSIDNGITK